MYLPKLRQESYEAFDAEHMLTCSVRKPHATLLDHVRLVLTNKKFEAQ